jgi:hypothetical protein
MLLKCFKCDFYVRKTEKVCLNCGESNSDINLYWWKKYKHIISFFTILAILIVSFFIFSNLNITKDYLAIIALMSALFVAASTVFYTIFKAQKETERENLKQNHTLFFKETIIAKRQKELFNRKNNLESVLEKIGNNPSKKLQDMQEKLLTAIEIVEKHFSKYQLQKHKIELVRLQNKMSFYLEEISFLDSLQTDKGIVSAENILSKIKLMQENINLNFSNNIKTEKKTFILQLQESAENCEKLREVLLSKQAMRALQGVDPIKDVEMLPNLQIVSHSTETFNIQTNLTDFSEDFERLETEYKRILAESETSQKLLNYEN